MPAVLRGLECFQYKLLFHILCLAGSQNGIGIDIADFAKVVETFSGSDIADIAGQDLKRGGYYKALCQILIFVSARLSAAG